jgi:hypothetical protein
MIFVVPNAASSQTAETDSLSSYFEFEDASPLSCLFTYFPPFFIQHGIELKSFVRSKTFHRLRNVYGDVRALDALFIRAMRMTNNNTAVSLLLATIASFDHRVVGLKIPVFNLYFPLSDESERDFLRRIKNLPSRLYADTPNDSSGDRDKLQHFLGSAFLTFAFESQDAAMRIGDFVEEGEEAFIVGGVNDDRDLRSDRQGQAFGAALLDDNRRLPSEFLKRGAAGVSSSASASCTGSR